MKDESRKRDPFGWFAAAAGVALVAVAGAYMIFFHSLPVGGPEEFGQFGDYLGGVANPILGFITIFLLLVSIRVQIAELKASREELADTRKEFKESNRLFKEQSELLQRQHQRISLEKHFDDALRDLHGCFTKRMGQLTDDRVEGFDFLVTLNQVRGEARIRGRMPEERWSQPDLVYLAKLVRGRSRELVNAAIALVAFTDNSLMTDIILLKVRSALGLVVDVSIIGNPAFQVFDGLMEDAIVARERMPFPEFVRHERI